MTIYNQPLYYEIAFDFVDIEKQINLFERFIRKYSKIRVKRCLDIGCGPSRQLRALAKRGYEVAGLDLNPRMLRYLVEKGKEDGVRIETVRGDFTKFKLTRKVDFAFNLMGTIGLIKSNDDFLSHLDCVAKSLKSGGLYLIENFKLNWADKNFFHTISWSMERDGIKVKATYDLKPGDVLKQTLVESLSLNVKDKEIKAVFKESSKVKMIFPQEFLTLVKLNKKFEFIGWFELESIKKLTKAKMDNNIILRRK